MAPQQHLILSWVLANLNYERRRDRIITTLCGIIPDFDGLGLILDKITRNGAYDYYYAWHRTAGHNFFTGIILALAVYFICGRKFLPAIIAIITYCVHLFCDLAGSAGPDGSIWPIRLFWPFSQHETFVRWQWGLNSWQNILITAIFVMIMLTIAAKKNRSFLEIFSERIDKYCINLIKRIAKNAALRYSRRDNSV